MHNEAISLGEQVSKRVYKHEGEPVLTTMLRRPTCPDERAAARRMEEYYKRLAETCRKRWEGELLTQAVEHLLFLRDQSRPFVPWEAGLNFHTAFQDEALVSIYCDVSETRGDKRPLVERTAVTWDMKAGAPRTLKSLLPGRQHTRKKLLAALSVQARARLSSGESLLDTNCAEKLSAAFSSDRFYLTAQGVTLFFPMYTLGPFAEGIPSFTVPLPDAAN